MPTRSSELPTDPDRLATISNVTTGEEPRRLTPEPKKDPAAVELGRHGRLNGGKKRMESMTSEHRKESARKAGGARWRGK